MAKKKHVHKWHKVHIYSNDTWGCALPDCTTFLPNGMQSAIEGKSSICWKCGNQFVLDATAITQDKPTCPSCRLGIDESNIENLISRISNS